MFDLSRFDGLYTKFNAKANACKGEADACEKALEGYENVSEESIAVLEGESEKCKTEMDVCRRFAENEQKNATNLENSANEYVRQLQIKAEIEKNEKELVLLNEKEVVKQDFYKQLCERENQLAMLEKGRDVLVARLSELKEVEDAIAKLEKKTKSIENDEIELKTLENRIN